jgi:polynucleotide 5'-kinase involved in rRNA processing
MTIRETHDTLLDDLVRLRGLVMMVGAPDTGKSTLARRLLAAAVTAGREVAYVDADVGQTTTGPPACVGLKWVRRREDIEGIARADELRFVGSTTPEGVVLQHVVATAALCDVARAGAELVVLDTTGTVSGVIGQTLKYHKMELCLPEAVVALQHGAELEPMIGMLRRFFDATVSVLEVDSDLRPSSPSDRAAKRQEGFATAFGPPLQRWRVRSTVFAPTLPAGLDLARLDRMLVGLQDATGRCRGLGVLEYGEDTVRVITNGGEDMRGLRLGSLRIDLETFATERVRLRDIMFGLDA